MSLATALTELEDAVTNAGAEIDRLREVNRVLLAACQRCLAHFERIQQENQRGYDSPMMAQCRAAIAKATGEA